MHTDGHKMHTDEKSLLSACIWVNLWLETSPPLTIPKIAPLANHFHTRDWPMKQLMNRRPTKRSKKVTLKLTLKPRRSRAERAAAARLLSILKTEGPLRDARISSVKRSVKHHAYENDLKLAIAVDRMARGLAS